MSVVAPTRKNLEGSSDRSLSVVSYSGLKSFDEGESVQLGASLHRSVQFSGPFGSGCKAVLQGSNDGVNFAPLTDLQGNQINKSAPSIESVQEFTRYVRPVIVGGDSLTDITCTIFLHRSL